ncbi:MAG: sodium-dependent bicarbonate transport family permease, partial [Microcystis sp.]
MDGSLILFNILNPPVLFFFLGMLAVFFKSDLEIPQPLPKLFSLYLLMAIGFKGGYELAESGINNQIALTLIASVVMACIVHIYTFFNGDLLIGLKEQKAFVIEAVYSFEILSHVDGPAQGMQMNAQ